MKVQNMTNSRGNKVGNQFIIEDLHKEGSTKYFQSYDSIIVKIDIDIDWNEKVSLDAEVWDYSVTTGMYRNQFLGETKKETQAKIDSGEYLLVDLN